MSHIHHSITELIGHTPLLELHNFEKNHNALEKSLTSRVETQALLLPPSQPQKGTKSLFSLNPAVPKNAFKSSRLMARSFSITKIFPN